MTDTTRGAYRQLKNDDGLMESLLGSEQHDHESHFANEPHRRQRWHTIFSSLEHVVVVICLVSIGFLLLRPPSEQQCARRLSAYSTATDAVEYRDIKFNSSVKHQSVYKGEPNPELDRAWAGLVLGTGLTSISDEILQKLGKSGQPSLVKFLDEDGGGYMATMEVSHQLHCLNLLRKSTYFDYYSSKDALFGNGPKYRQHLDHCTEILRQQLMCTADVGLITYNWVKGYKQPFPDFNTWHKCRDLDKVWTWNDEHAVHVPWSRLTKVGNEVELEEVP